MSKFPFTRDKENLWVHQNKHVGKNIFFYKKYAILQCIIFTKTANSSYLTLLV